jgi:hypothetical protein
MATTNQVLRNKLQGSYVCKIEGNSADTTTLDASATSGLPEDGTATLRRAMWTMASGDITVTWKGSTDKVAARFSGNGNWNLTQNPPVIANNAGTPTGDITIVKTTASVYSIILEFGTGATNA